MANDIIQCPSCDSIDVLKSLEPSESVHYGRVTCGKCGRFIKWLPKPKVSEISIVKLLHVANLEEWERKFLKLIVYRLPNSAEQVVVEAIWARYGAKLNFVPSGRNAG